MEFREWLVMREGVDASMGEWLAAVAKYARAEDRATLDSLVGSGHLLVVDGGGYALRPDYDAIVKRALKGKGKEDMNWLSFALGYLSKKAFRGEDLEMAIDYLERMKTSGEVSRAEVGRLGWMQLGASMPDRIAEYNRRAGRVSRTQSRKMAARGEVGEEETRLIRHVASEGGLDLYYLPPVGKDDIDARHRLLCKYGKGTDWCTASPEGTYHKVYSQVGIFIMHSGGSPKYQFVDCAGISHKIDGGDEETIHQFVDVNDQPVTSITPAEEKFLRRNANAVCYGLISDGFDSVEEFMATSDERAHSVSGELASKLLVMAGPRVGEVAARLGPALSRISEGQIRGVVHSESWGPEMADGLLRALAGLREVLAAEARTKTWSGAEAGATGLMVRALAASSDAAAMVGPLAEFLGGVEIGLLSKFMGGKRNDALARAILKGAKQLDSVSLEGLTVMAENVGEFLGAVGERASAFFERPKSGHGQQDDKFFERLKERNDGSLQELSRFMERMLGSLPPEAVAWAIAASDDAEATAKRILSTGLDAARVREVFKFPSLAHLADDAHVRVLTGLRKKEGSHSERLDWIASEFGGHKGDAAVDNMIRFLRNSDDLEGREVMSAIYKVAEGGRTENAVKLVERMPQDTIDLLTIDDIGLAAEKAEKSCKNHGMPDRERSGCDGGRPLLALLKRTRLNFPMGYLRFAKPGKDRDDLIIKNLAGSDTRAVRHALDMVEDRDRFVEELNKARRGKLSPGEIASIIGHSGDKKKALELFGDRIGDLDAPYEDYFDSKDGRILSSDEGAEDWMDYLTVFNGIGEMADELLSLYKKPLRPKAIANLIKMSDDQRSTAERLKAHIVRLDSESYTKLKKMMSSNFGGVRNRGVDKETIDLVDGMRG